MKIETAPHIFHRWDVSTSEAREIQQRLAQQVIAKDQISDLKYVAGIDVGFPAKGTKTRAVVVILDFRDLSFVEHSVAVEPTVFPYIPGLLSFREAPAILSAFKKIKTKPDVLLCDGQGIAHPRRLGIAAHVGLWVGIPSIGVAKSRLSGTHPELPPGKGSSVALMDGDEQLGVVLRSRSNVKPLYISIGHMISLSTAVSIVQKCITRYRLPETTRKAHHLASNTS